jgi:hypothetical protein
MMTIAASQIRANAIPARTLEWNILFQTGFQPVLLIPGNPRRIAFSINNRSTQEMHFSVENAYQFNYSGRPTGGIVPPLTTYDTVGLYVTKADIWIWYPFGVLPTLVTGFEYIMAEN